MVHVFEGWDQHTTFATYPDRRLLRYEHRRGASQIGGVVIRSREVILNVSSHAIISVINGGRTKDAL